jgi:hypothetical protein
MSVTHSNLDGRKWIFEYDDKINPMTLISGSPLIGAHFIEQLTDFSTFYSKNNVKKSIFSSNNKKDLVTDYTYLYNNLNFPIERTKNNPNCNTTIFYNYE